MIIDDFKGDDGLWVKTVQIKGNRMVTKSYKLWDNIRERCRIGGSQQKSHPTYIGCRQSEDFLDFQLFTCWHSEQIGYGTQGYHLDKDILFQGNKIYGGSTCVIVPQSLNKFLVNNRARRGKYPQGVSMKSGCFVAKLGTKSKLVYLGAFNTPEEASSAYKVAKEAEAYRWYERLRDGEFVVDTRVIERMRTWTFEESV